MLTTLTTRLVYSNVVTRYSIHMNTDNHNHNHNHNRNQAKGHSTMKLRSPNDISLTSEELKAIRDVLQNETAWDRDDTSANGGVYIGVNVPGYNGVHDQKTWNHLNVAMMKIDVELERRLQAIEDHKQRNR